MSLGHLGWRTDWALLRAVAERMPELVLLLVGEWHEDECAKDPDFGVVPLGAEPRLARPPLRRRGRAAHPLRRRRDPAVPRRAVQRRRAALPDPEVRAPRPADGLAGARRRAHVGPRGDDGRRRRRVRRRAARAGRRARAAGHRAARVGARSRPPSASTRRCGSACASSAWRERPRAARAGGRAARLRRGSSGRRGLRQALTMGDEAADAHQRERDAGPRDERDGGRRSAAMPRRAAVKATFDRICALRGAAASTCRRRRSRRRRRPHLVRGLRARARDPRGAGRRARRASYATAHTSSPTACADPRRRRNPTRETAS